MKSKRFVLRGLLVAAACLASVAQAAWPEKTITLVAPFAAGGNADVLARQLANSMSTTLGQTVIVENKPGAGGMLGSQFVARANGDGYTFLLGSFANVLNEFFYKKRLIDLRKDLAPVSQLVSIPNYVAVSTTSKYNNIKDLLDDIKARPGQISCGTSGAGTSNHTLCQMLSRQLESNIVLVPYRGGVPAIVDVIGGQTTFVVANEALPYIKDKRLKGLAVTSPQRIPMAPDLPPLSESVPGVNLVSWYGVFAPVSTPRDIVDRVSSAMAKAVETPVMKEMMNSIGATPAVSSPADFASFVAADLVRWERILKPMNVQLD